MDDDDEIERILREELGGDWSRVSDDAGDEILPRWNDLEDL